MPRRQQKAVEEKGKWMTAVIEEFRGGIDSEITDHINIWTDVSIDFFCSSSITMVVSQLCNVSNEMAERNHRKIKC